MARPPTAPPIRIVTDDGAAALSVFFPDPYELAGDLTHAGPHARLAL